MGCLVRCPSLPTSSWYAGAVCLLNIVTDFLSPVLYHCLQLFELATAQAFQDPRSGKDVIAEVLGLRIAGDKLPVRWQEKWREMESSSGVEEMSTHEFTLDTWLR